MSLTTTTLAAAMGASDTKCLVTSATGFTANYPFKVDQEWFVVDNSYTSGTTVSFRRGQNGTFAAAHATGANLTVGPAADFASPSATVIAAYPLSGLRRKLISYTASGAITLPTSGEDMQAVLNGTSVLAMTIAAPTKDIDGSMLTVIGNGAAAHTITFTGGLSGAGTSYDVITVNATAPIAVTAVACNGLWVSNIAPAMTGTVTALTGGVA